MQEEILDIVDDLDKVIGSDTRPNVIANLELKARGVLFFLINSEGKLWIPRRTSSKVLFPSGLDASAGGFVKSGESYEEAIIREVKEELFIDLEHKPYFFKGFLTPEDVDQRFFAGVYELAFNDSPLYNKEDFSSFLWLFPNEALEMMENDVYRVKAALPAAIKKFYL